MKTISVLIICCALMAMPAFAQSVPNPNACSPVGTWYGGGDYKYMITISPTVGGSFAITSEAVYSNVAWGYAAWTSWSGQLINVSLRRYVAQEISMYTTSTAPQPPPDSFEVDGVRGWMEFVDCDNIKFSYDFFGAYFDMNKVPFVDPPDVSYLPPGGIVETYRRMTNTCPACSLPTAPTKLLHRKH